MKTPVVLTHVAQCGTDATLRGNSMAASWKYFGYTGSFKAFFHHAECGAQTGATCANHDHVMLMFDDVIS
jgi:hypothetical protein